MCRPILWLPIPSQRAPNSQWVIFPLAWRGCGGDRAGVWSSEPLFDSCTLYKRQTGGQKSLGLPQVMGDDDAENWYRFTAAQP